MNIYEKIVDELADKLVQKIINQTIRYFRKLKDTTSGDSGLINVWDEICVQVQGTESMFWHHYEDMIFSTIEVNIKKLKEIELKVLMLQLDYPDDENDTDIRINPSEIVNLLYNRVCTAAANYSNKRIESFLENE